MYSMDDGFRTGDEIYCQVHCPFDMIPQLAYIFVRWSSYMRIELPSQISVVSTCKPQDTVQYGFILASLIASASN